MRPRTFITPWLGGGILAISVATAAFAGAPKGGFTYPETATVDQTDDYHGAQVADPYRWLEGDVRTTPAVAEWVAAENKVTFGYLENLPGRERIKKELTTLWNYEKYTAPFKHGSRYFFFKNDGLQNQSVLYTMESLEGDPRELLNPNTLTKDGTVALAGSAFSDDGSLMAYGLASSGSDWNEWRVRDVATGKDLPDLIKWVKFSGASWTKDGKGFYYSRFDEPKEGEQFQGLNYFQKVYFHRLGTPQVEDALVYENKKEKEWNFGAQVTEDGDYLVVTTSKGTDNKYLISYKSLEKPDAKFVTLIDRFEYDYSMVGNDGPVFYFFTDRDSPRGRLISIDITNPDAKSWRTIIPEARETLRGVEFVNRRFIAEYLRDASTFVRVFDTAGGHIRDVDFPAIGTAGGFGGKKTDTETFYSFSSFAVPPSIYRYDMITGKSVLMRQAKVEFNPDEFETKQVFYKSKDGTRIPMFLTHKKGLSLDGNNPTLLYAYGGFNIPITPSFSVSRVMWLKMGGVYAVANIRGGGEYGKEWHEAGKKLNKQNVFDDFIAAAEWLVTSNYTKPSRIAIQGGSNGGLLIGAVMAQRPDLFGVCLPAVGVMDMLRFHHWTAGRFWVDDYGSSDDAAQFKYLLGYSPYHNLKPGTKYPATLVTTADTDDRVVPGHSFKFAAKLQECQAGDAPVMIRIETKAGHGAGKPTEKQIEEAADILAFTAANLGMESPH